MQWKIYPGEIKDADDVTREAEKKTVVVGE